MRVSELREALADFPDDMEVRIDCCVTSGYPEYAHVVTSTVSRDGVCVVIEGDDVIERRDPDYAYTDEYAYDPNEPDDEW